MSKVRVLPDVLANQVAAGEVIERPGSVVKELIENSLDAGAKRIEIKIQQGGVSLIQIEDDGEGMTKEDALLALERHATSKLHEADQLNDIRTLGFRGEAIPSITSVSRFRLMTRCKGALVGTEIAMDGGRLHNVKEVGCPVGTQITVQDLFYNLPARRKFLKSKETESSHIELQIRLHALSHPHVRFVYWKDGRLVFDHPGGSDRRVRIIQFQGESFGKELIKVSPYEYEGITVTGYTLPAHKARKGRRQQFVVLNGRVVDDPLFARSIREGFGQELREGHHPIVWLWIEMNPHGVDVNVHPAKREVRFRAPKDVYFAISRALQASFNKPPKEGGRIALLKEQSRSLENPVLNKIGSYASDQKEGVEAQFKKQGGMSPLVNSSQRMPSWYSEHQPDLLKERLEESNAHPFEVHAIFKKYYVILEDKDGLVLLDVRGAHERILYEELMRNQLQGEPSIQPLLVPVVLNIDRLDLSFIEDHQDFFLEAGISVEPFGGTSIQVSSVPACLSLNQEKPPAEIIEELLSAVIASEGTRSGKEVLVDSMVQTIARFESRFRKASLHTVEALLIKLLACDLPYCTPDGRATLVHLSLSEIERKFR